MKRGTLVNIIAGPVEAFPPDPVVRVAGSRERFRLAGVKGLHTVSGNRREILKSSYFQFFAGAIASRSSMRTHDRAGSVSKESRFFEGFWEEIKLTGSLIDMKRNLKKSGTLPADRRKSERGWHYYYSLGGPECGIL